MMTTRSVLMTLALLALLPGTAWGRGNPFDATVALHVHLPAAPARDDATARRSIAKLDKAAMAVCGASDGSFAQVKAAVRQSPCWHQAMTGALAQVDDATLRAWWEKHPS
jgi:hypothetical protein